MCETRSWLKQACCWFPADFCAASSLQPTCCSRIHPLSEPADLVGYFVSDDGPENGPVHAQRDDFTTHYCIFLSSILRGEAAP